MKKKKIKHAHPGQPEKYKTEYAELARIFCLKGADDAKLAEVFGVNELTINRWKVKHPEFCKSIKDGKEYADAEVASSLFKQAIGFTRKVQKIVVVDKCPETVEYEEYFPPSTTAAIMWLKNRDKKNWRDKQDVEHGINPDLASLFRSIEGTANTLPSVKK